MNDLYENCTSYDCCQTNELQTSPAFPDFLTHTHTNLAQLSNEVAVRYETFPEIFIRSDLYSLYYTQS